VFPNAVSPKYSNESAGKARMHTCLDQYNAKKTNNGNGNLVWIQQGGGYYSECNQAPERLVQVCTSHPKRKMLMIEALAPKLVRSCELVQSDVCRKAARSVRRGRPHWC
jgi:hypothetical protein